MSVHLSIVIPTHNRSKELKSLLSQIYKQSHVNYLNISVVVVVDGSTDGTLEMLNNEFKEVHVVEGDGSWWYTKSMNKGFFYAIENLNPDYILTLNDDVCLAEDYFEVVSGLLQKMNEHTIIGSLGITDGDNTKVVSSGNAWKNKCLGTYKNHLPFLQEVEPSKLTGLHSSVTLPGRGMIIPVGIIRKLGGLDEWFKQYHSDGDFTLRAIKSGVKVYISWDLLIYVNINQTSESTSFLNDSFKRLLKSYWDPVSRNHLPSKIRFILRHGKKSCFPIRVLLFIVVTFRNVFKAKRLA